MLGDDGCGLASGVNAVGAKPRRRGPPPPPQLWGVWAAPIGGAIGGGPRGGGPPGRCWG